MTDHDGIHTCSYYCDRPACVTAQRDELRERYFAALEKILELESAAKKLEGRGQSVPDL